MVWPAAPVTCGQYTKWQPCQYHNDPSYKNEFKCGWKKLRDVQSHRPVGIERHAQITASNICDEVPVLNHHRIIEVHLGPQVCDLLCGCIRT